MSGRRRRGRVRSRTAQSRRPRRLWILYLLVLALAAATSGLLWLDHRVRARFDGSRFDLPARVLARPLEVYAGAPVGRRALVAELELLGYRRVGALGGRGEYVEHDRGVSIASRGFAFWDAVEPPRRVAVAFAGERVADVQDLTRRRALPMLRLEPPEIGRIIPAHNEDRVLVRAAEVPPALIAALLAAEDRRFYEHPGIDPLAIARAAWANLRAGRVVQGGSTLTQQLVKNLYLDAERTLWRKVEEALMAVLLELRYDKATILETYLNEVFLGQDGRRAVHGFGLAAWLYFGRPLAELTTDQLALLVGLVRGPSYYEPRRHPQRCRSRRNEVLALMAERGFVDARAAARLQATGLGIEARPASRTRFPAFMQLVRRGLRADYRERDLRTAGLRIFTTLDARLQAEIERRLPQHLAVLERERGLPAGSLQAAVVVVDAGSGEVRAVVGGRDGRYAGFNRALDARRPIGSLVKPAVYLAALRMPARYTPASAIEDAPLVWRTPEGEPWMPRNYDGRAHGTVTIERALTHSLNLATVRLGLELGYEPVLRALRDLGVPSEPKRYPSLFLGALELAPIDVARMYLTIANGGFRTPLRAIREVTAHDGRPLARYRLEVRQTVAPEHAFLVRYLLERVVAAGTARAARGALPGVYPVGGKTGTTNELRDAWFAGYAGNLLAVVWIGRDDNAPARLTGAAGALPVWLAAMQAARPASASAPVPERIEWRWIDGRSGAVVAAPCEDARRVPFVRGSAPPPASGCSERRERRRPRFTPRRKAPPEPGATALAPCARVRAARPARR